MLYHIVEETYKNAKFNAGSKARCDAATVLNNLGFIPVSMTPHDEKRATAGKIYKVLGHVKAARDWKKAVSDMGEGDVLLIQLPLINHTVYIDKAFEGAKKRGLKVIALIHDLEELRFSLGEGSEAEKARYSREGRAQRQLADIIIAHNESMKNYLVNELSVPEQSVVVLGIFDYLLNEKQTFAARDEKTVVIAGNLSPEKTKYIYNLPENVRFNLYGKGLDEEKLAGKTNITYKGVFSPDDPSSICGDYGLVWDGERADTCTGFFGAYLKYNAPHKTSLYLASGLPVIIWEEAGLAPLVKEKTIGFTVSGLDEIPEKLKRISPADYETMKSKAESFAADLRRGARIQEAILDALDALGDIFNN